MLLAAAEATGASPHDPSLRDRLGQASAGVAAAVKSLFAIHQQARQQQQQPAPQPSASSSSSGTPHTHNHTAPTAHNSLRVCVRFQRTRRRVRRS